MFSAAAALFAGDFVSAVTMAVMIICGVFTYISVSSSMCESGKSLTDRCTAEAIFLAAIADILWNLLIFDSTSYTGLSRLFVNIITQFIILFSVLFYGFVFLNIVKAKKNNGYKITLYITNILCTCIITYNYLMFNLEGEVQIFIDAFPFFFDAAALSLAAFSAVLLCMFMLLDSGHGKPVYIAARFFVIFYIVMAAVSIYYRKNLAEAYLSGATDLVRAKPPY